MLERISISFFRPKLIGKFLSDKMYVVIAYFCFLFAFVSIPSIMQLSNVPNLSSYDQTELIYDFKIAEESKLSFEENKLVGTEKEIYKGNGMILAFNTDQVENAKNSVVFLFEETSASIYYAGFKIKTYAYSSMSFKDFSLTDVQANKVVGVDNLFTIINHLYQGLNSYLIPMSSIMIVVRAAIYYAIVVIILLFLTANINPAVNSMTFRLKICIYAVTILAVMEVFSILLSFRYLYYLGIILAYFAASKALRSIVRIEIKR